MAKLTVRPSDNAKQKPIIELVDLVKQYGDKTVLKDLNIAINKGEFVTLLGASGSGKTTALRLIAGFEWPTRGEIKFYGVDVKDLPAYKRPTNTIFQDYALFPHLTVEGNIKYGLKLVRVPREQVKPEYEKLLAQNQIKWAKEAEQGIAKVKKEQAEYEETIKKERAKIEAKKVDIEAKRVKEKAEFDSKFAKEKDENKKSEITANYEKEVAKLDSIANGEKLLKKIQKWHDKSDFMYSYWETYVQQKSEAFENKNTKRPLTKEETKQRIADGVKLIGLEGNEKKSIDQLSGGMKQRVAIARALVTNPQVLLLDEPLSALDAKIRQHMQRELRAIQKKLGLTFILVTHDQEEAMTMSDRIAVMRDGRVEQFDTPQKIYDYPVNSWVASFIGDSTLFKGTYVKKGVVNFLGEDFKCEEYDIEPKTKVDIMLRPEDFEITTGKGFLKGKITRRIFQGSMWEYRIAIDGHEEKVTVETNKKYELHAEVSLKWDIMDIHVMPEDKHAK